MTFSESKPHNLPDDIERYFHKYPGIEPADVLKKHIAAWVSGELRGRHASAGVFWSIWWTGRNRSEAFYTEAVRVLDRLYSNISIPDVNLFPEVYVTSGLIDAIHIVAARFLCLKKRHGLSEEALDTATEVVRLVDRLCSVMEWEDCPDLDTLDDEFVLDVQEVVSTLAVCALLKLELSRDSYWRGENTESLELLASAAAFYQSAAREAEADLPLGAFEATPEEAEEWASLPEDSAEFDPELLEEHEASENLRGRLGEHLGGLPFSLDEANHLWQQLMADEHNVSNWAAVVDNCNQMMETLSQTGETDRVLNHAGDEVSWRELWLFAKTEAAGRLRPSELAEWNYRQLETQSEDRIRLYVFGDAWNDVNNRCRSALINADVLMTSSVRGLRFDSIYNELQRAAEAMCYEFVWLPVQNGEKSSMPSKFSRLLRTRRRKDPGIVQFIRVLEAEYFKTFLQGKGILDHDVEFLTKYLPCELKRLNPLRNLAEHKFDKRQQHRKVRAIYYKMLGCGGLGILPELARIGPKIAANRNR